MSTSPARGGALVAMSGGVDSSVAAMLAREQGHDHDCVAVTMILSHGADASRARQDIDDAAAAARLLGMTHETLDCAAAFERRVIETFIRTYEEGRTPDPCILCNRHIKFGALLDAARARGMERIVTGHYARVERDDGTGRYLLRKAVDLDRDQSYVLYALSQEQLARAVFPLGGLTKARVRELAEARGLPNARKRGSQDICFVQGGKYADFIERRTGRAPEPGWFVDEEGRPLGQHGGIIRYTPGQRKGLGLSVPAPLYVLEIDARMNRIVLTDEDGLLFRTVFVEEPDLISVPAIERPMRVTAKLRYRQREAPATVSPMGDGRLRIDFDEPQRAPAKGQAAVFYDGDVVVGGGTICGAQR